MVDPDGMWTDDYYFNFDGSHSHTVPTNTPDQLFFYNSEKNSAFYVGGFNDNNQFVWNVSPFLQSFDNFKMAYAGFIQRSSQDAVSAFALGSGGAASAGSKPIMPEALSANNAINPSGNS
jgi:hypothetical protein